MADTHLTRSITSTSTSWTLSVWVKRALLSSTQYIMSWGSSGSTGNGIGFSSSDRLQYYSEATGSNPTSSGRFRDNNGWYHVVVKNNAGTITLYINGETLDNTGGTSGSALNSSTMRIGDWVTGAYHYDGIMSHLHFIDGTAYSPSTFGETDSTTGEWKIKTLPSVTYGSDGFFILKDGNSLTDQSGNGNNYTLAGGTLTKTEDCPSNVFATMTQLGTYDGTLSNGNTRVKTNQTNYRYIASTLGVDKGRYYWECKLQEIGNYMLSGITDTPSFPASGVTMLGNGSYDCAVYTGDQSANGGNGHLYHSSTSNASNTNTPGSFMAAFDSGHILTFALDLDSATKKLYIGANGQWANGSGATNQTFDNATGVSIVTPANTNSGFYFPACGDYSGTYGHWEYNFGNGYFGTTAVSSAGTNASNNGIFEYDVPAGYTALCTKGINSF